MLLAVFLTALIVAACKISNGWVLTGVWAAIILLFAIYPTIHFIKEYPDNQFEKNQSKLYEMLADGAPDEKIKPLAEKVAKKCSGCVFDKLVEYFKFDMARESEQINYRYKLNENFMKKEFKWVGVMLLLLVSFVSCSKEDEPSLSVSKETVNFTAPADEEIITVSTNQATWKAVRPEKDDWCSLRFEGALLIIEVDDNLKVQPRTTTVTVYAGNITKNIVVEQAAANEALSFVPDKVELDASGEAVNVTITTNTDSWTYNVDKTWCNVSRNGDVLSVSADEYTDGEPRSAVITVKAGSLSKDITVTQSNTGMAYAIDVPADFSASYVQKIMYGDVQIAEVCKEFIKTSTVSEQMVVVYPVVSGKTDLTKGLAVKDGGNVVWDIAKNSCTYTAGTAGSPLQKVYLEKDKLVATSASKLQRNTSAKADILVDLDYNKYRVVKIGTQYWIADNFKCERYSNGSPINKITSGADWKNDTEGAFCYVNNDPTNYKEVFGALYNWNAVVNSNKLAPEGWDIPTQQDFLSLKTYIVPGADPTKAIKCTAYLKATDGYWQASTSVTPNNLTGFSMQPAGWRTLDTSDFTYSFDRFGYEAYFWSTTEYSGEDPFSRNSVYVMRAAYNTDNSTQGPLGKVFGMSVRCIKR